MPASGPLFETMARLIFLFHNKLGLLCYPSGCSAGSCPAGSLTWIGTTLTSAGTAVNHHPFPLAQPFLFTVFSVTQSILSYLSNERACRRSQLYQETQLEESVPPPEFNVHGINYTISGVTRDYLIRCLLPVTIAGVVLGEVESSRLRCVFLIVPQFQGTASRVPSHLVGLCLFNSNCIRVPLSLSWGRGVKHGVTRKQQATFVAYREARRSHVNAFTCRTLFRTVFSCSALSPVTMGPKFDAGVEWAWSAAARHEVERERRGSRANRQLDCAMRRVAETMPVEPPDLHTASAELRLLRDLRTTLATAASCQPGRFLNYVLCRPVVATAVVEPFRLLGPFVILMYVFLSTTISESLEHVVVSIPTFRVLRKAPSVPPFPADPLADSFLQTVFQPTHRSDH